MPRKDAGGSISAQAQQDLISDGIENYELPKSIVTRIAKSVLPDSIKMQKETVLSLVKGSTVFINYLAATAHDVALSKQHKSISASDVLKALETIEFGDLVDQLQDELQLYRELGKADKNKKAAASISKGKGPASESSASTPAPTISIKGKERAVIVLPARNGASSISTPLGGDSISSRSVAGEMEIDDEDNGGQDIEEEEGEGDEVSDEDEEEPEELVDTVARDAQDLQSDARGLEDTPMEE
ncbi:Histone-fold-containing protein [Mycena indigotica]|uniref:DNA polymerase epsilon subunit D n=1 Tax=Mycena indigotica TaxID=2126181 RepID=A0A8H6SG35_9AGAR|nr:Histone-fold-containing protein [Mycena indigotica]KAF7297205.1 Histone-fold-containing protein [Mycena indigotica]